ncbi:MAG: hypothetical protein PHS73_02740, partial [Candidatus Peribacteraceae bacterium]|nr:hypothetical protein [Candidatus Peribacteraceae bacterium]
MAIVCLIPPRQPHPVHRHRHFVALPLVLAVVVFVFLFSGMTDRTATASMTGRSSSASHILSLADGTRILPEERSVVQTDDDVPELVRGSMLVSHPGLAEVQAAGLSLSGLSGAFHVVKNGAVMTVSALTSPVLVTDGDRHAIVQIGRASG